MAETEILVELFKAHYTGMETIEDVLLLLKNNGATQGDSASVLRLALKLPLPEIDKIIMNSKTWEAESEQTRRFRRGVYRQYLKGEFDDEV